MEIEISYKKERGVGEIKATIKIVKPHEGLGSFLFRNRPHTDRFTAVDAREFIESKHITTITSNYADIETKTSAIIEELRSMQNEYAARIVPADKTIIM